ncbi:MAG: response regulator [Spirochaetia bacterium]|nr:response regulator [Spirochaetia bacterium]
MILLVDDSRAQHALQEKILTTHGIPAAQIRKASHGEEALNCMRTDCPRLMVLDWNMPGMTGLEIVRKVREENKEIAIVMVTSESDQQRFIEALEAGANGYITKPITSNSLWEAVQPYLT